MAKINLLPWRQELRAQRKREFFSVLGAVFVAGVVAVMFWHSLQTSALEAQRQRNESIAAEITKMDEDIKTISDLQKRKDELVARMKVIQDLQGKRPVIVRIFDELVRVIPDGVYIQTLDRTGDVFKISGVAATNNQISNMMRNIQASPWFKDPVLSKVATDKKGSVVKSSGGGEEKENGFSMSFTLEVPDLSAEAAVPQGGAK